VSLKQGDVVAVSGTAHGVGSIAVQLARRAGAKVIGIAGSFNQEWLTGLGMRPVAYAASWLTSWVKLELTRSSIQTAAVTLKLAMTLPETP
jgi:NADPH:quinone reductase-like Zn-dependent oxidoreductase